MNQQQDNHEYNDINLRQIVGVFLKRGKMIFGITILFTIVVLSASLAMPKVYEVKTVLEIGTVPGNTQAVSPEELVKKINSDFYVRKLSNDLKINASEYSNIKAENFADNLIAISMKTSKTQQGKEVLNNLVDMIIGDYSSQIDKKKSLVSSNIDIQKKDIDRLNNKIKLAESDEREIAAEISLLAGRVIYNDIGAQLVMSMDKRLLETKQQNIEDFYLQINRESQQINELSSSLDQLRPMAVVEQVSASQNPKSPLIPLNTVAGAMLGFFAGVFWAFGIEWWQNSKNESKIYS